ncbi:hypothetical protein DC31_06215 [Microbacterium sp. CH12i]|uniref:hypothetical protein n=1 Tax=Microbacterium sp. CH12i TaxID=1479651 RepID=UPI000461E682|nr:hypothetical protein [Microbacterium sp. CH12i]KDA04589.1 hypothetical protein DC31_06215 [Microbacterium sp. CH12i]
MTIPIVESPLTILYETLIDLAASADRQAARAAEFDDTTASSALFILADELRTMAQRVKGTRPDDVAFELLDSGQWHVATSMLRFDFLERATRTTEARNES